MKKLLQIIENQIKITQKCVKSLKEFINNQENNVDNLTKMGKNW